MDGRNKRKVTTETALRSAVERLKRNEGHHPRHVGLRVKLTNRAVALEAGVGVSTVYRFPAICDEIKRASGSKAPRPSQAEQRRRKMQDEISELKMQIEALLAENVRLTRETEEMRRRHRSIRPL